MLVPKKMPKVVLTPIEAPWVIDIIDEYFDDAVSMLDETCVIYGGAIRDALAGIKIEGDLDILIPDWNRSSINGSFISSTRWSELRKKSNYPEESTLRHLLSSIHTYVNSNGREVQIISPLEKQGTKIHEFDSDIINVVSSVDIVCCGVMMDIFGNVFEVAKGALDDCKRRELHLSKELDRSKIKTDHMLSRIKKLEKRGWINKTGINKM